ncbi:MAG: hypothetical protein LBL87_04785 [Ruminococcus sp.]|nr:hypothetical protein [Ruminococcus sp.]
MIVNLTFEDNFCDLSKSDINLADVIESLKGIADEEKEIYNSITVRSGEVWSNVVNIGNNSLGWIIQRYKLSSYVPEGVEATSYRDLCYKENKFAHGKHKVISITRQATPCGKTVNYEILCE